MTLQFNFLELPGTAHTFANFSNNSLQILCITWPIVWYSL